MAKLVQPTSDWAPDYVKTREECGGEEQCPAFPRDIIRNQTDLTYVDVDCASTRGHQDFPASTRGEAAEVRRLLLILVSMLQSHPARRSAAAAASSR